MAADWGDDCGDFGRLLRAAMDGDLRDDVEMRGVAADTGDGAAAARRPVGDGVAAC